MKICVLEACEGVHFRNNTCKKFRDAVLGRGINVELHWCKYTTKESHQNIDEDSKRKRKEQRN